MEAEGVSQQHDLEHSRSKNLDGSKQKEAEEAKQGARKQRHSVAQSLAVYHIFNFLDRREVVRLQGLNRFLYHRRVQQYLATFLKKEKQKIYTREKFDMPHRARPPRRLVLRDCSGELDDEDSDDEPPKAWLFEGTSSSYELKEFSLDIPWCTCQDGPHKLLTKQVFNLEKMIVFFNRAPTGCQPMISYIEPFGNPTKLYNAQNSAQVFQAEARVRAFRGEFLKVYFYEEGGSVLHSLHSLQPSLGLICAGQELLPHPPFKFLVNDFSFVGFDWTLSRALDESGFYTPYRSFTIKFKSFRRVGDCVLKLQREELLGSSHLYNPFSMRLPLLFMRRVNIHKLRSISFSNVFLPEVFEHDTFYMDEIPDYLARPFLPSHEGADELVVFLGVKKNELTCKVVNFAEFEEVNSFAEKIKGA